MDVDREKTELLAALHHAVKACQRRFGGKREIASNNTESCVSKLLTAWENVLNHGLHETGFKLGSLSSLSSLGGLGQISNTLTATIGQFNGRQPAASSSGPTFWQPLKEILSGEEAERFQGAEDDKGRCREWLREKINESSLERFVHTFLGRPDLLLAHYRQDAFVRDADRSAALPNLAAGINSIIFALSPQPSFQLDDDDDECAVEVAAAAQESSILSTSAGAAASKPLRRPRPIVVSFDDDDAVSSAGSDLSASFVPESGYNTCTGYSRSPPRDSSQLSTADLRQAVTDVSRAREREATERRRAQDECRRLQAKVEQLQRENGLLCQEVGKEERLARLAEMHADVSELNSQLQLSLLQAQRELELLRGPAPRCSEYPLYVSIVAAFKRGAGPTRHHVYQLHCHTPNNEWCSFRRYQQFLDFHEAVSKQYPDIRDFYFPPKEKQSLREQIVRKRWLALQTYVRDVVNYLSNELHDFTNEASIMRHMPLLLNGEALMPKH